MGDTIVQGPEGRIKFPDGMSPTDIQSVMDAHYGPKVSGDQGHAGVYHPGYWDQLKSAIPAVGQVSDVLTGKKPAMSSMPLEDVRQLAYPERVYSATEQAQHPVRTGIDQVIGGLSSPENLLLMQGMGGPLPAAVGRTASAVFATQMAKGSYDATEGAVDAYNRGDMSEAKRLGTHAVVGGLMAVGAGAHAGGEELKTTAKNLWEDESARLKVPGTSGEVVPNVREPYPSQDTMLFRSYKKLEYSQRDLMKAIDSEDPDKIDAAHKQVLRDTIEWAKWAPKDDVNNTLTKLRNNLASNAAQLEKMQSLTNELVTAKASFFGSAKDARQVSREEFRNVAGASLPPVPSDFAHTLPEDVQNAITGASPREQREMLGRYWGASFLVDKLQDKLAEHNRNSDIAATLAQAKNIRPEEVQPQEVLPKRAQATETPASSTVGGEAPSPASTVRTPESIPPTQEAAGRAEPVRPTEGSSVKEALNARIAELTKSGIPAGAAVEQAVGEFKELGDSSRLQNHGLQQNENAHVPAVTILKHSMSVVRHMPSVVRPRCLTPRRSHPINGSPRTSPRPTRLAPRSATNRPTN